MLSREVKISNIIENDNVVKKFAHSSLKKTLTYNLLENL